jgi:hypothetical protein
MNQDVENGFPLRSRIAQTLNVPQRVRIGPSLATALPETVLNILQESVTGRQLTAKRGGAIQGLGRLLSVPILVLQYFSVKVKPVLSAKLE